MHWLLLPILAIASTTWGLAAPPVSPSPRHMQPEPRAGQPANSLTSFANLPGAVFYLDDTPTVLYHDTQLGNVYVSHDEGKTFSSIPESTIPKGAAWIVILHPFDNSIAFILSTSSSKHWLTRDRGQSWTSFEVDGGQKPSPMGKGILEFHISGEGGRGSYVIFHAMKCEGLGWWERCWDVAYVTKDLFATSSLLMEDVSGCRFAHSSKDFKHSAEQDLIYCVAQDEKTPNHDMSPRNSRLFYSTDFFKSGRKPVQFDLPNIRDARGIVAFAIVSKFGVAAMMKDNGDMVLYVTVDAYTWSRAHFPHASNAQLRENAYTIMESSVWSLGVDVVLRDEHAGSQIGTLFVSNSNGTYFVESLKGTNRNGAGFVDYEKVYGLEGVGIANIVDLDQPARKILKTKITFDDGRHWQDVKSASGDLLHLHSVTTPHNYGRIFSSPAPGILMAAGSLGASLRPYSESDTFLSTDGGLSWSKVASGPHKYEMLDSGAVLFMMADDDEYVDSIQWSDDFGKTWKDHKLPYRMRCKGILTVPDATSRKALILGQVRKEDMDQKGLEGKRYVTVHVDFAGTKDRQCGDGDLEKWYARGSGGNECLMGHKQYYKRRKTDADCYVGNKFQDPVEYEENCACGDTDYECDFNYVLQDGTCVAAGPEPVAPGICKDITKSYMGSSGWRKIPGNTCQSGKKLDEPVSKPCTSASPAEGEIIHKTHQFSGTIDQWAYFREGTTMVVKLHDGTVWQSPNEGWSWKEVIPGERFLLFYHHVYSDDRAYLITSTDKFWWTTDGGQTWIQGKAPSRPNSFGNAILKFHPNSDWLIWIGEHDCEHMMSTTCRSSAWYSTNNGHQWHEVEQYVTNCGWAKDRDIDAEEKEIVCESYREKSGSQRVNISPLELIVGGGFYDSTRRTKVFDGVVGFTKFSEFMVVATINPEKQALDMQVSLDGQHFATGQFPPGMNPATHAYTVLESTTHSLFMFMTIVEPPLAPWGNILKSNSNGTYFGLSLEGANRNEYGYVDFEKMVGLPGIALVNIVANKQDSSASGRKVVQSRITHNDGATWKPLVPPKLDSLGQPYECNTAGCDLHIHGYTERRDPRATYSSPSAIGLLFAVGNVGTSLKPYTESDTFLSRDAGFTWEEVHKDAHMYEFGDSGSVLIMANDEEPIDHVLWSIDQGQSWRSYKFVADGEEKLRVTSIATVPSDTSRRFVLLGSYPKQSGMVAVHLDFQQVVTRQCRLDVDDSENDDFERWSPAISREEPCLFGRQVYYHRRKRDAKCWVGDAIKKDPQSERACECTTADFECEYNYVMNADGECVLHEGVEPLGDDTSCANDAEYWYSRTPYRKISFSSCEGGKRPDRGAMHVCEGFKAHGALFWWFVLLLPFAICALVGWWYYKRSGMMRGRIRLPGDAGYRSVNLSSDGGVMDTIASIPWFLLGIGSVAWEWVVSNVEALGDGYRQKRGYRNLPVDEDAQILRFADEE